MGAVIYRVWAMPNHETFAIPPIGAFVSRYLAASRTSIDPFARNRQEATYTNDLNPKTTAVSHEDARDFLERLANVGIAADLIIIDPPYSPRQVKECYDSIGIKMQQKSALLGWVRGELRKQIARLVVPGGVVLWFGWNTTGMGQKYGYQIEEIMLVCHGSDHNDTICMAERRPHEQIFPDPGLEGQWP